MLVLIGVAGEVVCDWKEMTGRLAWAKKISAMLLVIGLTVEFWESAKLDNEVANTKERTVKLESTNLLISFQVEQLRQKNDELEAKAADRHISEKQRKDFIKFLENSPKGHVMTGSRHPDSETQMYCDEVYSMLTNAGFTAESRVNYAGNLAQFPVGSSVGVFVDNFSDAPAYSGNLFAAFSFIGLKPTFFTNVQNRAYSFDEGNPSSNQVIILVVEKH